MKIRLAKTSDLEQISRLSRIFMQEVGMDLQLWEKKIPRITRQINSGFVLVCELENVVVGYTAFYDSTINSKLKEGRIHITNAVVDPRFRRRGIAEALRRRLIEFCREHGYSLITTNHHRNNDPIIALSKKLGFIEYEDDDFKADSDDIFFKLNIDISN